MLSFRGRVTTLTCNDSNPLVREGGGAAAAIQHPAAASALASPPLLSPVLTPPTLSQVRKTLNEDGAGRVLVIDGGASRRCALVGDRLTEHAYLQGWAGILINGCVRDVSDLRK